MGKLSFRFGLGRGGGGGGGGAAAVGGGAFPPYRLLVEPPFLLLTLVRIGLGGGAVARAGEARVSVEGAQGRFAAFRPSHRL